MASDADGRQFEDLILELAMQDASGRLLIAGADGNHGWVWLRDGQVSGASGPGPRPLLANRLLSFGMMPRSSISKMIAEARSRPGIRLFDLLLEHESVPTVFLDEFVTEATAEQILHIRSMGIKNVRFENGQTQRAGPILVPAHVVLDAAAEQITDLPGIPPSATFLATEAGVQLPDAISTALMTRSDGSRTAKELANTCGLTLHEALTRIESLIVSESLAIAPPGSDTEPWAIQRPLPTQDPGTGSTAATIPTRASATSTGASREPPVPSPEPEEGPTITPPDASVPISKVTTSHEDSADPEILAPEDPAGSAAEPGSLSGSPRGFTEEDLAKFTTGMASVNTPSGAPPPPTPARSPEPTATADDSEKEPPATKPEQTESRPAPSAADRRDLMSNLSALSQELHAGDGTGTQVEGAVEPGPTPAPAEKEEPRADQPKKESGRGKKSANPEATSEMFRELRSLADDAPESPPNTDET